MSCVSSTTSGSQTPSQLKSFVRLRPLLPKETGDEYAWEIDKENTVIRVQSHGSSDQKSSKVRTYAFDWVFPPHSSSSQIYEGTARQLVQSTMQGYNSALFFYGPNSTGKSYTRLDLMSLAAQDIFQIVKESPSREFVIGMSAVEIYNEDVNDLIGSKALSSSDVEVSRVEGLRSADHLLLLMSNIEEKRIAVQARTKDRSGAHVVFRIYVESRPLAQEEGDATLSEMSFVDLSGSEGQSQGSVNRSLTAFTRVIRDLAQSSRMASVSKGPLALNKSQHIPYRESKLTKILQATLSGSAHMAIICTASPSSQSFQSTREALRFASEARDVAMRPNVSKVTEDKSLIQKIKSEIEKLMTMTEDEISRKKLAGIMSLILRSDRLESNDQGLCDSIDLSSFLCSSKPLVIISSALPPRKSTEPSVHASWAPESQTMKKPVKGFKSILSSIMPSSFLYIGSKINASIRGPTVKEQGSEDADSTLSDDLTMEGDLTGESNKVQTGHKSVPPVPRLDLGKLKGADSSLRRSDQRHFVSQSLAHLPLHSVRKQGDLQGENAKRVEAAMETIKNELRCMKHTASGGAVVSGSIINPPSVDAIQTELKRLEEMRNVVSSRRATRNKNIPPAMGEEEGEGEEEKEEEEEEDQEASPNLVDALRAQLVAIQGAQEERERVDNAIGALQERFGVGEGCSEDALDAGASPPYPHTLVEGGDDFQLPPPPTDHHSLSQDRKSLVKSSWSQGFFGSVTKNQQSPQPSKTCADQGVAPEAKQSTKLKFSNERSDRRLTSSFRASAAREVGELKEAIDGLREKVEMLEMHKRLLLTQYVHLEGESKAEKDALRMQAAKAIEQRELAKYQRSRVEQLASAMISHLNQQVAELKKQLSQREGSSAGSSVSHSSSDHALSFQLPEDQADEEGWGRDSEKTLMPRIITLWDKLCVPLVYRSRFYVDLRDKDVFYFDMELRRLEWKQSQIENQRNHVTGRSKEEERNKRALLNEQRDLASQLKWNFTDEQRESLMQEWGVNLGTNQRKLQLVKRLWHPHTLNQLGQEAGAQKCAQVVLNIAGSKDASGQFMELVFGGGHEAALITPGPAIKGWKILQMMTPRQG